MRLWKMYLQLQTMPIFDLRLWVQESIIQGQSCISHDILDNEKFIGK